MVELWGCFTKHAPFEAAPIFSLIYLFKSMRYFKRRSKLIWGSFNI